MLEALEADLLSLGGYTLDDVPQRLPWRAVLAFVDNAPRTCALVRRVGGERARWGPTEYILADIYDVLRHANWQRTRDGSRGVNFPAPYPRPGITNDHDRKFGSAPIPASGFYDWFYDIPEKEDA